MGNWDRKDELKIKAVRQTEDFANRYKAEIRDSVNSTTVWDREQTTNMFNVYRTGNPEICIKRLTTSDAIFDTESKRICILNFASYKNPGGAFLLGSLAQEEALCHSSILFNVLREYEGYYSYNRKQLNKGLYKDRALYSNNVIFFDNRGKVKECDVLTCAAPNKSLMFRYKMFTEDDNRKALESRVDFIRKIVGAVGDLDEVVLGAWGCGVFKQDTREVAELLVKYFKDANVKRVTFAIPDQRKCSIFADAINRIRQ